MRDQPQVNYFTVQAIADARRLDYNQCCVVVRDYLSMHRPPDTAAMCACKNRPATACPGEWEPGCDLGANAAHVGDSQFDSAYRPAGKGDKQRARDAYAAGLGDPAAARAEVLRELLVRDLAADLGVPPLAACKTLENMGHGPHSVNMAVTAGMARELTRLIPRWRQERTQRLVDAIEGECDGMAISKDTAREVLQPGELEKTTSPLSGKYGEVLGPFLALMDAELHANCSKGDRPGWLSMSPSTALLEIYWHTAKLSAAVKNDDSPHIREHAADVANMAMILLDVCGGLGAPQ